MGWDDGMCLFIPVVWSFPEKRDCHSYFFRNFQSLAVLATTVCCLGHSPSLFLAMVASLSMHLADAVISSVLSLHLKFLFPPLLFHCLISMLLV